MSLLERIVASKRQEVQRLAGTPRTRRPRVPIDVIAALRRDDSNRDGELHLIAEVKLRSPSAGPLSRALPPEERALAYAESGAAMVSILCDGPFFDGAWEHLSASRKRLDAVGRAVPLLAKEFVLEGRQIEEARDRGADAVLLIARIVDPISLGRLAQTARDEGIEPFIEVTSEAELATALQAGARVVGVNARDLDTLAMDAARTARVLDAIPAGVVAVHLSGLREAEDITRVAASRADAALVGEALMREDDPRSKLERLVQAARAASASG